MKWVSVIVTSLCGNLVSNSRHYSSTAVNCTILTIFSTSSNFPFVFKFYFDLSGKNFQFLILEKQSLSSNIMWILEAYGDWCWHTIEENLREKENLPRYCVCLPSVNSISIPLDYPSPLGFVRPSFKLSHVSSANPLLILWFQCTRHYAVWDNPLSIWTLAILWKKIYIYICVYFHWEWLNKFRSATKMSNRLE